MRAAAPPLGGPGRSARRLAVLEPGVPARGRREGAAVRMCAGGGGVPAARTWGCSRAQMQRALPRRAWGPNTWLLAARVRRPPAREPVAGPRARERGSRPLPPRVRAWETEGERSALPTHVDSGTPHAGGPAEPTTARLAAPKQVQPIDRAEPPRCRRGPARLRDDRPKPASLRCWDRPRGQVGRRPGSQRRKVGAEFKP